MLKNLLLLAGLAISVPALAQDTMTKFSNDVCGCLGKVNPQSITTHAAMEEAIQGCLITALQTHQKELKKKKVLDVETATEEQVIELWKNVFSRCEETAKAVFGRQEELEEAEANASFQGIITYVQSFDIGKSFKKMGITREMMQDELKKKGGWLDTLFVYYRSGNYAAFGNDADQTTKVYDPDENIIFSFSARGKDVCAVQEAVDLDLSGAPDKPIITVLDSVATILGHPCKIIRMKWPMSQFDYYYNETQVKVNPALFANHSSEGFSEFVRMSGCLPLQIVRSMMGMIVIQTAAQIQSGQVNPEVFAVPELMEDESLNQMKLPGIRYMRVKR